MWCAKDKSLTYDEAKMDGSRAKKDIKLVSVKYWIGFYCHIARFSNLGLLCSVTCERISLAYELHKIFCV